MIAMYIPEVQTVGSSQKFSLLSPLPFLSPFCPNPVSESVSVYRGLLTAVWVLIVKTEDSERWTLIFSSK